MKKPVNKILKMGEKHISKVMDELLSNDRVSAVVAQAMTHSQGLKSLVDKNISRAFSLVNQPTREDFDKLRKQVRHLERHVEDLGEQLEAAAKNPAHTH